MLNVTVEINQMTDSLNKKATKLSLCCKACDDGFYDDCQQTCGKCLHSTCNKTDGQCPLGCEAGYWGELCNDGNVTIQFQIYFRHCQRPVMFGWFVR